MVTRYGNGIGGFPTSVAITPVTIRSPVIVGGVTPARHLVRVGTDARSLDPEQTLAPRFACGEIGEAGFRRASQGPAHGQGACAGP